MALEGDIDVFTDTVWNSLNEDNKVSCSPGISISGRERRGPHPQQESIEVKPHLVKGWFPWRTMMTDAEIRLQPQSDAFPHFYGDGRPARSRC